jgi:hypothetical protein
LCVPGQFREYRITGRVPSFTAAATPVKMLDDDQ